MLETAPLVSFAVARGRCQACGVRITLLHPLGELAGLLSGAAILVCAPDWRALPLGAMAVALLGASVVDARTRRLPDLLVWITGAAATVLAVSRGMEHLAIGVAAALISVGILMVLRARSRARRGDVGLGLGDVKLVAALALWLGALTPWMVLAASLLGLAAFALRRSHDDRMAFGPAIAIAGFAIGLSMEAGLWPVLA
jgi:leader peptidase (prepilin peptidase)/N-methyltransferase